MSGQNWLEQTAAWIPFIAAGVGKPGAPMDNDRTRTVAVRLAEVSIIVGVLWWRIDGLEERITRLREQVYILETQFAEERGRAQERRDAESRRSSSDVLKPRDGSIVSR